jgi:hypothetical protein
MGEKEESEKVEEKMVVSEGAISVSEKETSRASSAVVVS